MSSMNLRHKHLFYVQVHMSQNAGLPPVQSYGDLGALNEDPAGTSSSGAAKPRVRARRGQATDPHSIAERVSDFKGPK